MNQDKLIKKLKDSIYRTQQKLGAIGDPNSFADHYRMYQIAYHSVMLDAYQVTLERVAKHINTLESCTCSILADIAWDKEGAFENPFECALVATRTKALAEVARQLHKWADCYKVLDECAKEPESLSQ